MTAGFWRRGESDPEPRGCLPAGARDVVRAAVGERLWVVAAFVPQNEAALVEGVRVRIDAGTGRPP